MYNNVTHTCSWYPVLRTVLVWPYLLLYRLSFLLLLKWYWYVGSVTVIYYYYVIINSAPQRSKECIFWLSLLSFKEYISKQLPRTKDMVRRKLDLTATVTCSTSIVVDCAWVLIQFVVYRASDQASRTRYHCVTFTLALARSARDPKLTDWAFGLGSKPGVDAIYVELM